MAPRECVSRARWKRVAVAGREWYSLKQHLSSIESYGYAFINNNTLIVLNIPQQLVFLITIACRQVPSLPFATVAMRQSRLRGWVHFLLEQVVEASAWQKRGHLLGNATPLASMAGPVLRQQLSHGAAIGHSRVGWVGQKLAWCRQRM